MRRPSGWKVATSRMVAGAEAARERELELELELALALALEAAVAD
jgi:hypothetical protein